MKKQLPFILITLLFLTACRQRKADQLLQGKTEKDQIAVAGKVPGRILEMRVSQGDLVKKGDTLAILDIPEIEAKKAQASGAVKSAEAQYQMARKGATIHQLKQLNAKKKALEGQYAFAKKSLKRLDAMVKDSLIPQQKYDETFSKYQGAQAQLLAVNEEIAEVENGVRTEQQTMALGQQDRALGALQEAGVAEKERYILAPQDMSIETVTLHTGELALPGYTLFTGLLERSTHFRFTVPESELGKYEKGKEIEVNIPYRKNQKISGIIKGIKPIGAYANIATAYPDYDLQDPLFEIIIYPKNQEEGRQLLNKTTVTIKR